MKPNEFKKYNGTDPKQISDERNVRSLDEQNEETDLKKILSLAEGRRLIWRYLSFCGVYRSSFHSSGSQTFYNEGMRNVGLMITHQIMTADPDAFTLMMKEAKGIS